MAQETPSPENWGDPGELDWTTRPEYKKDPEIPELTWDIKAKDLNGTKENAEAIEETPQARAQGNEAVRKLYEEHHQKPEEESEQRAA